MSALSEKACAKRNSTANRMAPSPFIYWLFILFVFSIPFELLDMTGGFHTFTATKLFGLMLVVVAVVVQPEVCFARPPKAFWCFVIYLIIYSVRGYFRENIGVETIPVIITLSQCLILFWLSYNIILYYCLEMELFKAMMLSIFIVALLSHFGIGSSEDVAGRMSVFQYDPNHLAYVYSIGLLAGLAIVEGKTVALSWRIIGGLSVALLLVKSIGTGSRGGMLCLVVSIFAYCISARGIVNQIKKIFTGLLMAAAFIMVLYHSDVAYNRWMDTIKTGNTAKRDTIIQNCLQMIIEKPWFGWGPTTHCYELGIREGERGRLKDTHSDILWAFTATGLSGGIFFTVGLWLCIKAGWQGRTGRNGTISLAFMVAALVFGLTCTAHKRKPVWISASLASVAGASVERLRQKQKRSESKDGASYHQRRLLSASGTMLRMRLG